MRLVRPPSTLQWGVVRAHSEQVSLRFDLCPYDIGQSRPSGKALLILDIAKEDHEPVRLLCRALIDFLPTDIRQDPALIATIRLDNPPHFRKRRGPRVVVIKQKSLPIDLAAS